MRGSASTGAFRQEYHLTTGKRPLRIGGGGAVNQYGQGKTLLIDVSSAVITSSSTTARDFFAGLLQWANLDRHLGVSDPRVTARAHTGTDRTYLWVINPTRTQRSVKVGSPPAGRFQGGGRHLARPCRFGGDKPRGCHSQRTGRRGDPASVGDAGCRSVSWRQRTNRACRQAGT